MENGMSDRAGEPCRSWRRELAKWIEEADAAGEPARIPPDLAEHASRCRECAVRLEAARRLLAPDGGGAPADLTERVWTAVRVSGAGPRRKPAPASAATRRLRLVAAAAVVVVAVATGLIMGRGQGDVVTVRLTLEAPGARRVSVVGDWNGWKPDADRLVERARRGVWEGTVRLRRLREYRYQFLVDGERWVPDPAAPVSIDDGFGSRSSVLQL
jgi:hypothetical protein